MEQASLTRQNVMENELRTMIHYREELIDTQARGCRSVHEKILRINC